MKSDGGEQRSAQQYQRSEDNQAICQSQSGITDERFAPGPLQQLGGFAQNGDGVGIFLLANEHGNGKHRGDAPGDANEPANDASDKLEPFLNHFDEQTDQSG